MVIALLSLPVAIAGRLTRSLLRMMLVGAVLSALFTTVGLAISYEADLPSGATTIVLAGAAYLLTVAGSGLFRRRSPRAD